ncbi:MAG: LytR family transcriptional regulator, partial [Rhodococcus sp. (in: high G+C Gram-positive bacteria)]
MPRDSGTHGGERTPPPHRRTSRRADGDGLRGERRDRDTDPRASRGRDSQDRPVRPSADGEPGVHRRGGAAGDERRTTAGRTRRPQREPRGDDRRPDAGEAPRRPGAGGRWPATHVAVAVLSVLVLLVTGFAWRSVDSLRSNIATAGGLGLGGAADGAVDILMVGTDSRTDAHGNALSPEELASLNAGEEVASNTDTIVLI